MVLNIISLINAYSYQIKHIVLMNDWKKRQFVLQVAVKCDRYLLCFDFWNIDVTEAKLERGLEKTIDNFFHSKSAISNCQNETEAQYWPRFFSYWWDGTPADTIFSVNVCDDNVFASIHDTGESDSSKFFFFNFWCTFRRKCRCLTTFTFKSCHLLFWYVFVEN